MIHGLRTENREKGAARLLLRGSWDGGWATCSHGLCTTGPAAEAGCDQKWRTVEWVQGKIPTGEPEEVGDCFCHVGISGRTKQSRWGRAAARALPKMVGTGCRPSVTSPRVVGRRASRRLDRTPCRAAWTDDLGHDRRRLRGRQAMPQSITPHPIRRPVRHF